jgi:hypothetical protein
VLQLLQQRYLVERNSISKSNRYSHVGLFQMSSEMLSSIVGVIENHAVFHNFSMNDQAPIPLQVAVTIRRLCCESSSSGSSVTSTAQLFGISEGAVVVFTKRPDRYPLVQTVKWPNRTEK